MRCRQAKRTGNKSIESSNMICFFWGHCLIWEPQTYSKVNTLVEKGPWVTWEQGTSRCHPRRLPRESGGFRFPCNNNLGALTRAPMYSWHFSHGVSHIFFQATLKFIFVDNQSSLPIRCTFHIAFFNFKMQWYVLVQLILQSIQFIDCHTIQLVSFSISLRSWYTHY